MITRKQQREYLQRMGGIAPQMPNSGLLTALHEAHLKTFPFENLDVALGRRIEMDEASVYDKLIGQQRGGFCYELNSGFYALLQNLGFKVSLLSGRVFHGQSYGKEFDHLFLLVELEDGLVIADVGFGDSFRTPVALNGTIHKEAYAAYRIVPFDDGYQLMRSTDNLTWEAQYRFTIQPRQLSDFAGMCDYHQNSPESVFTQKWTCSIATDTGRVTLSGKKRIVTTGQDKRESPIESAQQYMGHLKHDFGISFDDPSSVERWFSTLT